MKSLLIAKREFMEKSNTKKTLMYIAFVVITSLLLIKALSGMGFGESPLDQFFFIGYFWTIGLPLVVYLGSLSIGTISKEITEGNLLLLFSHPIKRVEYLFGKFGGLLFYSLLINFFTLGLTSSLIGVVFGMGEKEFLSICLLYTSPSPRDLSTSRMPSSA